MEPARVPGSGGSNPNPIVPITAHPNNSDLCTIHICPTTGGGFDISVLYQDTIDSIKKTIAQRLKLSKERISLLFKDRYVCKSSFNTLLLHQLIVIHWIIWGSLDVCNNVCSFFYRILKDGSVLSNGLYEDCRLTLLPHVESGLIVSAYILLRFILSQSGPVCTFSM